MPGDFARIEADNKVTLLGRGSNCINTGGEKVYPEEVEMALKGHPDVYDCLVVGVADENYGQAVSAVIQPRGEDEPTLEELRSTCGRCCRATSCRAHVTFVAGDPAQRHRQGELPQGHGELGRPRKAGA